MTAKSRVRPHLFVPPPPDELDHNGRGACQRCGLVGEPGDAHHTLPPAPEAADARELAAGDTTAND